MDGTIEFKSYRPSNEYINPFKTKEAGFVGYSSYLKLNKNEFHIVFSYLIYLSERRHSFFSFKQVKLINNITIDTLVVFQIFIDRYKCLILLLLLFFLMYE